MKKKINEIIEKRFLNKKALEKFGVSDKNILKMDYYYERLDSLFNEAKILDKNLKDSNIYKKEAKRIGKELDNVEKKLQKLWNFEYDESKLRYWYLLPGCKCPRLDNLDRLKPGRIINCDCPYHSFLCKKSK